MDIFASLDNENLHHAYLIEGARDILVPEVLGFVESLGVDVQNNPDFCQIMIDNFKIDEAMNLREMGTQRSFTTSKKFFVVCANSFSLDAQQALLKMFEEPIENTHFFVIVPEADALIKTLISRFYVIASKQAVGEESKKIAEQFIKMPLAKRIDFIKELLADNEEEDLSSDSPRSKALKFLNALELTLHGKFIASSPSTGIAGFFEQILKVREFLRQPGSATKTLLESVALSVPVL